MNNVKVKYLKDNDEIIVPITSTKAVFFSDGKNLEEGIDSFVDVDLSQINAILETLTSLED